MQCGRMMVFGETDAISHPRVPQRTAELPHGPTDTPSRMCFQDTALELVGKLLRPTPMILPAALIEITQNSPGQPICQIHDQRGSHPPGRKPRINPTNLTYSTPMYAPKDLVGVDLASGSSSASGVLEQNILAGLSMVRSAGESGHLPSDFSEGNFGLVEDNLLPRKILKILGNVWVREISSTLVPPLPDAWHQVIMESHL